MRIKRHRRRLRGGEERLYTYAVSADGSQRRSLSIRSRSGSLSPRLYRSAEKRRIVAALKARSSLLVVGEPGAGKTFLAEAVRDELEEEGFLVAAPSWGTVRQVLVEIAEELELEVETGEGKAMNVQQLQEAIADWLEENVAFVILDGAHRFSASLRGWFEKLHAQEQPMLFLATYPPRRDIFLKLARLELEPLGQGAIREILEEEAAAYGLELSSGQLASLQERVAGNPMLAKRAVEEERLGVEGLADHAHWVDGTPFLIAALMGFVILRFLGLGFNNTSLYLLGGIVTVAVGVARIAIYSLPKPSNRLGQ